MAVTKSSEHNLVIIDADSIIYIVASKLQDLQLEPLGIIQLNEFISDILIATNSKAFIGFHGKDGSKNFRYDVAVTRPYKGKRSDKEDWFKFWSPILKAHMEVYWGFHPCDNIEADDACGIAANTYRNKYAKVTIAGIDKDLLQVRDMHHYNYRFRTRKYLNKVQATKEFLYQFIEGDTTDNIEGLFGAGKAVADKFYADHKATFIEEEPEEPNLIDMARFYVKWYTEILPLKASKKQQATYLVQYKKDNALKRLTAAMKKEALKKFELDMTGFKTEEEAIILYKESYDLLYILQTKKEGKKYGFTLPKPEIDNTIDWASVIQYEDELEGMVEEQIIEDDFLEGI